MTVLGSQAVGRALSRVDDVGTPETTGACVATPMSAAALLLLFDAMFPSVDDVDAFVFVFDDDAVVVVVVVVVFVLLLSAVIAARRSLSARC